MQGHEIYKYAVRKVPEVVKKNLDKAGIGLQEVKKVLIHQANEKMDEAIVKRFLKKCKINKNVSDVMPMSISELGNSSVGTIPTLYDMVLKGQKPEHKIDDGDVIMFASVGAGMNINAIVYKH